jgi:parallel beta-helix repeat protein
MRHSHSVILSVLLAILSAPLCAANTLYVPSNQYHTIQSAATAAQPGDTILISPRSNGKPYEENVLITTPNIQIVGTNGPVLDGTNLTFTDPYLPGYTFGKDGITLAADNVTVTGLTVQNYNYPLDNGFFTPAAGIAVHDAGSTLLNSSINSSAITNNTLSSNGDGLRIVGRDNYTIFQSHHITGNILAGNHLNGADIRYVDGEVICEGNVASGNGLAGLYLGAANGSTVRYNALYGNGGPNFPFYGPAAAGLSIAGAGEIQTNSGPVPAIPSTCAYNDIHDNAGAGIFMGGSINQTLLSNALNANGWGIYISQSFDSTVQSNSVYASAYDGILLDSLTSDNLITYNTALNNGLNNGGLYDAEDQTAKKSAQSVDNRWRYNTFGTANPAGIAK